MTDTPPNTNSLDPNDDVMITAYMNASLAAAKVPRRFEQLDYYTETGEPIAAQAYTEQFETVESLEKEVFLTFFEYAQRMVHLESSEEDRKDPARYLLSFYYTLFEVFAANREYIALRFASPLTHIKSLFCLDRLKSAFESFFKDINQYEPLVPVPLLRQAQEKLFTEAGWLQFLSVFEFWLKDTSPEFERTDALIEKSLMLGLDVLQLQQTERHLADWARFWTQNKP